MIRFFLALALWIASLFPACGQAELSIDDIVKYLNSFTEAQADFEQVNSDGTVSTGRFFIKRPGRFRFQYDPPDRTLIIAGQRQIAIFDGKSNEPPQQIPISRTPMSMILGERVEIDRPEILRRHSGDGLMTWVIVQNPEHYDNGWVQLVFSNSPIALREVNVDDGGGSLVQVRLSNLETGVSLDSGLFSRFDEIRRRFPDYY